MYLLYFYNNDVSLISNKGDEIQTDVKNILGGNYVSDYRLRLSSSFFKISFHTFSNLLFFIS